MDLESTLRSLEGTPPGSRFRALFNLYFGTDFPNGPPEKVLGAMADFLAAKLREAAR